MIWIYTGTPGSGKSLHCAKDIMFKINRGQRVIANFPINEEYLKKKYRRNFLYLPDDELTPHYLFEFAKAFHKEKKEGQTLIFIDEAQRLFPIDRNYTLKKEWEHFFQLHRHYGYNIILCTQQFSYINKGIRIQAEYEVKHRKINNYRVFGFILGKLCGGALFTSLEYWVGARQCTNQQWFTYRKKFGRLYDTFGNFKTDYIQTMGDQGSITCLKIYSYLCFLKIRDTRKVKVKVAPSCPTLCNPMHYIVHGILHARILEWVAFLFSRGSSQPRDRTQVSNTAGRFFTS